MLRIWNELRRRKVVRVAIVYAIAAWVMLQVGDTVVGLLDLPPLIGKALVAVVVLCFPVVLVISWIYDWTPEGLVATDSEPDDQASSGARTLTFSDPGPIDVQELALAQPRLTELVGRSREAESIAARIAEANNGEGGIILIVGEPGIGKTRLSEGALDLGLKQGMLPLVGHAYEEQGAPFIVAAEVLEGITRILPDDVLRNVLGNTAPEICRLLPELRLRFPEIPDPVELPPEQRQRYLFNAILNLITRLSSACPLVILLDDMHWADESSISLLEYLAPQLPKLPVLLIVTYRDVTTDIGAPFKRALANLNRQSYVNRIPLQSLGEDGIAGLLASLGGPDPPAEIVNLIYRETDGNVFFAKSVFQHLAEEGCLFDDQGQWRRDIEIDALAVPEEVRLVIQRRLEHLAAGTQTFLAYAAVMGVRFAIAVIETASEKSPDEVCDAVDEAEAAQLVQPTADAASRYQFSHALVRQTLLEGLSGPRRQRMHLKILDAMEATYHDRIEAHVEQLAHHASLSESWEKAVLYGRLAADRAMSHSAYREAVGFLTLALTANEKVPATRISQETEIDICSGLANALLAVGEIDNTLVYLDKALEGAGELADRKRLASLYTAKTIALSQSGDIEEAIACGIEGRIIATDLGDVELLMSTAYALGEAYQFAGRCRRSIEILNENLQDILGPMGQHRFGPTGANAVHVLSTLCTSHSLLGDFAAARDCGERAYRIAERSQQWYELGFANHAIGIAHADKGEFAEGIVYLRQGMDIAREHQLDFLFPMTAAELGWTLAKNGEADEAVSLLSVVDNEARGMGSSFFESLTGSFLAKAYMTKGLFEEGIRRGERALGIAVKHEYRWLEALARRVLGCAYFEQSPPDIETARKMLEQSKAICERHELKPDLAHCHLGLGRLFAGTGDKDQAQAHLRTAITLFEGMEMNRFVKESRAALSQLAAVTQS